MKRFLTTAKVKSMVGLLALCTLVVFSLPLVAYAGKMPTMPPDVLESIAENYPNGLPAYMTPEEQQWLDEQEEMRALGLLEVEPLAATLPPTGTVWTPAEYEQLDGVLVAWEGYTSLLTDFVVEVSQPDTNATVYVVVDSTSERSSVTTTLTNAGADMSNVEFLVRTTDTVWIRDYGPRYYYEDASRVLLDFEYNRPRPNDDGLPAWLASHWNDPLYDIGLEHGGGNFHAVSDGNAFMSTLVLNENSGYSEQDIKDLFYDFHNVNVTIWDRLPSGIDSTGHIDMWLLPLSDTNILVSEFSSGTGKTITDGATADLEAMGYTVHRTPAWVSGGGTHYTYTNAAIVNNKVFIPEYSGYSSQNAMALAVFEAAMPDHEIIQIDCSSIISAAGAIHCVMKHVYTPTIAVDLVISGYILESDLTPIEGVSVDANNGGGSDTTDIDGYYEVSVPDGWSGTVTPTKTDYTFNPSSRAYTDVTTDQTNQDYTATYTPDLTPPTPSLMTWASLPSATGPTSITMTATTATDDTPPVYYYFECTNYGDANSGWQLSETYVAEGLSPETEYTFRVKARDSATAQNETGWSSAESATTPVQPPMTVYDFSSGAGVDHFAYGTYSDSWSELDGDRENCPDTCTEVTDEQADAYDRLAYSDATGGDSDTNRYINPDEGYNDESTLRVEFNIAENPSDIVQIDASWEGYGDATHHMELYIWDYVEGNWGNGAGLYGNNNLMADGSGNADFILSGSVTTNVSNYISPTGQITLLIYDDAASEDTFHDYVSVTVHSQVGPTQHTITSSAGPNGSIDPNGDTIVNDGDDLSFTATADLGYEVDEWSVDGNSVQVGGDSYTLTDIQANHTVNVTFTILQYTVTGTSGANGSIDPAGDTIVDYNDSLGFTAVSDTGYEVDEWSVDGNSVQVGGDSYTLTDIQANHTVNVTFTILQYIVTGASGANGSIDPAGDTIVDYNDSLGFTAVSDTGYEVDEWSVDGNSVQVGGDSYTLTDIQANHTVNVTFTILQYTVTGTSGANGSIAPAGDTIVDYNDSLGFTATADTGYEVDEWTVDGNSVQSGGTSYTLSNITDDHTVNVTFTILQYTVTGTSGANGSIAPAGDTIVDYNDGLGFTAVSDTGYEVDEWSVDGNSVQVGGDSYTLTDIQANHTVNVTFTILQYIVTGASGANGSIAPAGDTIVDYNDSLGFTATADTGYEVDEWTVDGNSVQSGGTSYTLSNITDDHTVNVTFTILQYIVTGTSGANGSIAPAGDTTVDYNDSLGFTATPDTGYEVDEWTLDGNSVQSGGTGYTLNNITDDHTVNVTFTILQYIVTGTSGDNGSIAPAGDTTVDYNDSLGFTATPDTGYEVDEWTVDGNSVQVGGDSYLLSNITASHTVHVTFSQHVLLISGYVLEPDGNTPVDGVSIFTDYNDVNAVTDSNGYYELWVDYGWSGIVTPDKEGYVFEPNSDTYSNVTHDYNNMDYTATLWTFVIAGYVLEPDYVTPINDVNVSAENGGGAWTSKYGGGSCTTDTNGYYEVWVDYNWSGEVVPTKYAYVFEPNSIYYEDVNEDYTASQDYTGTLLTYRITGYIKNECEVPIKGVLVSTDNGGGHDNSDANGYYEVWVDYNWSGTVTPTKENYTFDPNRVAYFDVLSDIADQNYAAYNPYDLDCDATIGWGDVAVICENWLLTGPDVPGDLYKDEDDTVNFLDFAEFSLVWGVR